MSSFQFFHIFICDNDSHLKDPRMQLQVGVSGIFDDSVQLNQLKDDQKRIRRMKFLPQLMQENVLAYHVAFMCLHN